MGALNKNGNKDGLFECFNKTSNQLHTTTKIAIRTSKTVVFCYFFLFFFCSCVLHLPTIRTKQPPPSLFAFTKPINEVDTSVVVCCTCHKNKQDRHHRRLHLLPMSKYRAAFFVFFKVRAATHAWGGCGLWAPWERWRCIVKHREATTQAQRSHYP